MKSNILDGMSLEKAFRTADRYFKKGSISEAKAIYADIVFKYPKNGRAAAALNKINQVSSQGPKLKEIDHAYNLYRDKKYEELVFFCNEAISRNISPLPFYILAGIGHERLGQFDQAISKLNIAVNIEPTSIDANNNLGVLCKKIGDLDSAIYYFSRCIDIEPRNPSVHNNIANCFALQGNAPRAIENYKKAIEVKKDYPEAYFNLANSFFFQNNFEEALENYKRALFFKPDYEDALRNFGLTLRNIGFNTADRGIEDLIIQLLDKNTWIRPKDIAKSVCSLIKSNLSECNIDFVNGEINSIIKNLSNNNLLLKFLPLCPLPDPDIECYFRTLRSRILVQFDKIENNETNIRFLSALSLHCFTNEYVYDTTEYEEECLNEFEVRISDPDRLEMLEVLIIGCYKPIYEISLEALKKLPDPLDVFTRLIFEPLIELELREKVILLNEVSDEISGEVQKQYENNPYPRWVKLATESKPTSLHDLVDRLNLKADKHVLKDIHRPEVLIAGCGTGQHPIYTSSLFSDCKVLAVDLSKSSIAYAQRKSNELEIDNIKYIQSDILDLRGLEKQFDLIESVGVLHHMRDPMEGWSVLNSLLKPGGLMKIGLYSERARQHITKIRKEIKSEKLNSSNTDIRSFRSHVLNSDKPHHRKILHSDDFYSLSNCRDLLFHVQEHLFTIEKIQDCIKELQLKFCGFETHAMGSFLRTHSEPDARYNLNCWAEFEDQNPDVFSGMYSFWCQK